MEERIYCTKIELDTSKVRIWRNYWQRPIFSTKEETAEVYKQINEKEWPYPFPPKYRYYTIDFFIDDRYRVTEWDYMTDEKKTDSIHTFRKLETYKLKPKLKEGKVIWTGAFDWWDTRPLTEEEIKAKAIAFLKPIIEQSGNIPLE